MSKCITCNEPALEGDRIPKTDPPVYACGFGCFAEYCGRKEQFSGEEHPLSQRLHKQILIVLDREDDG